MELPTLVCRYADRFAALGRGEHQVGSPLGAWLLLALAAPTATGDLAEQIGEALGADIDTAHHLAVELLAHPHHAVSAAAAAWAQEGLPGLEAWLSAMPDSVQTGPVPTQGEANAWARRQTLGLIDQFPLDTQGLVVLLASTLATRVTWVTPFETAHAADLRGPWSTAVTRVLRTPKSTFHDAFITDTDQAGRVAVHTAQADGLRVTSVIAESQQTPADVIAAAHEIAVARAQHRRQFPPVSLFDLPLGEQPLWTITEEQASERGEYVEALIPAWHAASKHDLLVEPELGFDAVGPALQNLADLMDPLEAAQSTVARYGRLGFVAAAVTVYGVPSSGRRPHPSGPFRTGTLRFAHPYAVVAVTQAHGAAASPWEGLPVFAAWIAEPDEAQD